MLILLLSDTTKLIREIILIIKGYDFTLQIGDHIAVYYPIQLNPIKYADWQFKLNPIEDVADWQLSRVESFVDIRYICVF
jgi:hypothetical protein